MFGGPVETDRGYVLHSGQRSNSPATLCVTSEIALTPTVDILRAIARGTGPEKFLFVLGYAGWGPGQLESELARHDWFTAPEEPKLIFDDDRANLWEDAMARRTREL